MSLSRKPIGLGKTLALAISLCSMGSGAVLAQGADYARKSGLPTSQERLEKKAGELAKRAVNHEANSALKKESAQGHAIHCQ